MFVPQEALNPAHPTSEMCQSGTERNQRRVVVGETEECMGRVFSVYGSPLTAVPSFKYLGRMLFSFYKDWPAVEQSLRMAWIKWGQLVNILRRYGADRRTMGRFYVVVVQAMLIFRSDM